MAETPLDKSFFMSFLLAKLTKCNFIAAFNGFMEFRRQYFETHTQPLFLLFFFFACAHP